MECYKCGGKLGKGRFCRHCGSDVLTYKRIVRTSNRYYNLALDKARVRDLGGAAELLSESLQLYKKNTDARNLLGLVYYEMGEIAEALAQWVISTNLTPGNAGAEYFLNKVQAAKNDLERMNKAIKRYNLALDNIRLGSYDLAVIALKRAIALNKRYVRAHELLALLHLRAEEYSKASKVITRCLSIDSGSTCCALYEADIKKKSGKRSFRRRLHEEQKEDRLIANAKEEVIVPDERPRRGGRQVAVGVVVGIGVSLLGYFALIRPAQLRAIDIKWNDTVIAYNEKSEDKDLDLSTLTETNAQLESQVAQLQSELAQYKADGQTTAYDRLLTAADAYINEDWVTLVSNFEKIDKSEATSPIFSTVYDELDEFIKDGEIADKIYDSARELVNAGDYANAITAFETVLSYDAENDGAIYYLGICYEAEGDEDKAKEYFTRIVEEFPDSRYYSRANSRID